MKSRSSRYHRQTLLRGIGEAGQERLANTTVLVLGCGALGCVVADMLARAGIGHLILVDRDVVEVTNLQRQVLFDEDDVVQGLPKSEAAKRRLEKINSDICISSFADDLNHTNIERYAADADVLVDGLDNFETRYLANDVAVKRGLPYVYGAAVGTSGMVLPILPRGDGTHEWQTGKADRSTPCFRCLFPDAPPPGASDTCETVGVLNSLVGIIANLQVTETLKIASGNFESVNRKLITIDPWTNDWAQLGVDGTRAANDCPCCDQRRFDFLDGTEGSSTTALCGRNAVQLRQRQQNLSIDFATLEQRLAPYGAVSSNEFLLKAEIADGELPVEITLFKDGRAIIKGTDDPSTARSIYTKFIGA